MTAISTRSSASAPASADRPKRERQTRLQEHLRTVKPGSRSSSPSRAKPSSSAASSSASKTVPKALAALDPTSAGGLDDDESSSMSASTASGRPLRKAAAKVVMHEPADPASGDESVEEPKPAPTRTPTKRRSPVDDDAEALAPSIKSAGRSSTGRKMPAQRAERSSSSSPSPSKKRAREPSSLEFGRMDEAEVQGRLAHEKAELMARLAPLGINPQDHVLDEALRAMSKSNTQFTVESFISTLASLDANVSPRAAQSQRPNLSVAVPTPSQAKHVSFSTLESPSTPSSLVSPSLRHPTPPQASAAPVAVPGLFYSSPAPPHAALPSRAPMSAVRPGQLLGGSLSRSFSAPVVPTLGNPQQAPPRAGPAPSGSLFGAAAGMGRVATRRGAPGTLGQQPQTASSPVKRATLGGAALPSPAPVIGAARSAAPSSSLLPAFALGAHAASSRANPGRTATLPTSASTSRLSKLQSWLAQGDDDGTSEDEDEAKKPGATAAGAEAMLKAAAATSKVAAAVAAPPLQLIDAPPSDDERSPARRARVGGKSVQGLRDRRNSRDQHVQPQPAQALAPALAQQQVAGDAQGMTTRRRASVKGKGRAVLECTCGSSAEGEEGAVSCIECDAAFHLACLDVDSVSQLVSPWTCSRCLVAAAGGVEAGEEGCRAATPKLADKRVRIGTTTTPHLYQEPTLVASTPVAPPRGNNFSHCADMALAPSPTASPPGPERRRLPIPVTPHFGEAAIQRAPGDYSPTSPQNYRTRAGRTRMISGGAFLNGEWLNSSWDSPGAPTDAEPPRGARETTPVQSGGLSSLVDGDVVDPWQLPAWSDVTMTPSRALTSSATPGLSSSSASSSVWDTPFGHASPHAHLRRANSSYHAPTLGGDSSRTPSHDFLAALERDPAEHSAPGAGHTFGQRLFYGAHEQLHDHEPYEVQAQALSSSPQRAPSPLNPRRVPSYGYAPPPQHVHPHHLGEQQQQHQAYKQPSLGDGLANPWSNNSLGGALAHERTALSASMKPSFSAPGVARFSHQLGHHYGGHEAVEQQMLDDLLV
ncbi:uncharacterized protein RHOBADRAFT_54810 [Rhodotorula graminis WP1]|uniref:Zinc finger PHD-type domain-containing protein n=1 Tax=Rhodotorula graminis (strain WP1) TaxID=578459 RepID=A0A0P9FD07_RHOGW|nr:uncharacterized protein RHOBADRAFT_54810 [Rhodotorula graminis WP1]KPV73611.1 hypothetical protein RHOBADRAFT_54810 [Rhodotorula graminis WP1]